MNYRATDCQTGKWVFAEVQQRKGLKTAVHIQFSSGASQGRFWDDVVRDYSTFGSEYLSAETQREILGQFIRNTLREFVQLSETQEAEMREKSAFHYHQRSLNRRWRRAA